MSIGTERFPKKIRLWTMPFLSKRVGVIFFLKGGLYFQVREKCNFLEEGSDCEYSIQITYTGPLSNANICV